jgi:prolipoprotein diacylglyceryltransferase
LPQKERFMKALFWIGTILLVLGLASFFIPITRHEREGFKAGGASIGIEIQHQETVSPIISAAMILAGAGLMIAAKKKTKRASR